MALKDGFISFLNLIFPCVSLAKDPSDKFDDLNADVDQENGVEMLNGSCVSELPDFAIQEILLKLPVESIICCKRVCKRWGQLISDPYFGKVYFKNSAIVISRHRSSYSNHFDDDLDQQPYSYHYVEIEKDRRVSLTPLNRKALTSRMKGIGEWRQDWKTVIGSCGGLLCVVESPFPESYDRFFPRIFRVHHPNQIVWIVNPLTGEYTSLPRAHGGNNASVVYGFGSTANGDRYKVIRVVVLENLRCVAAQVFTIGVDKEWRDLDSSSIPWRMHPPEVHVSTIGVDKKGIALGSSSTPCRLHPPGVHLNGILHWIGVGDPCVIYALDIEKENGDCLTIPTETGNCSYGVCLGVWDGHLCITSNCTNQFNIWTMKQYGVVESWSRIIVTSYLIPWHHTLIPITTMNSGELLLTAECHERLLFLDPKTKKVEIASNSGLHAFCLATPMLLVF